MAGPITLPQDHCDMCTKVIQMADEVQPFIQQCLECGLPVEQYADIINAARDKAIQMKKTFHPDKP
jgi:hypothetical protein